VPVRPATSAAQLSAAPAPTGLTMPMPVTTTRRCGSGGRLPKGSAAVESPCAPAAKGPHAAVKAAVLAALKCARPMAALVVTDCATEHHAIRRVVSAGVASTTCIAGQAGSTSKIRVPLQ
jgi:hypothetical protein